MFEPDPSRVAELQRKYSGLDSNLKYIAGHTINNKYSAYKAASDVAADAGATYKATAAILKQKKPYNPNDPAFGPVRGNGMYTRSGHQTLAPLAGTASSTAAFHADRRDSFNNRYQEVLEAKAQYRNHVGQAENARNSSGAYAIYQQQHQRHSREG